MEEENIPPSPWGEQMPWGSAVAVDIDLDMATSEQQLLRTTLEERSEIFYWALRIGDQDALKNLFRFDKSIVNQQVSENSSSPSSLKSSYKWPSNPSY